MIARGQGEKVGGAQAATPEAGYVLMPRYLCPLTLELVLGCQLQQNFACLVVLGVVGVMA